MNHNMPTMTASSHIHSVYSASDLALGATGPTGPSGAKGARGQTMIQQEKGNHIMRRVVQVFIADSDENISLDDCLLFKGDVKITDATDQELFFELDIKALLDAHNTKRTTVIDKKVKDRTEYLEPAKVRDLKMVVVTVANL